MLLHEPLDRWRHGGMLRPFLNVGDGHVLQVGALVHHRRHGEIEQPAQHAAHEHEGDDDGEQPILQPALHLQEVYDGKEQIGYDPRHKERDKRGAQIVDEPPYPNNQGEEYHAAHEAVEVDFFGEHSFILSHMRPMDYFAAAVCSER